MAERTRGAGSLPAAAANDGGDRAGETQNEPKDEGFANVAHVESQNEPNEAAVTAPARPPAQPRRAPAHGRLPLVPGLAALFEVTEEEARRRRFVEGAPAAVPAGPAGGPPAVRPS